MTPWKIAIIAISSILLLSLMAILATILSIKIYRKIQISKLPIVNPSSYILNPNINPESVKLFYDKNDSEYHEYAKDFVINIPPKAKNIKSSPELNIGYDIYRILDSVEENDCFKKDSNLMCFADAIENKITSETSRKRKVNPNIGDISYKTSAAAYKDSLKNNPTTTYLISPSTPANTIREEYILAYMDVKMIHKFKAMPATLQHTVLGIVNIIDLITIHAAQKIHGRGILDPNTHALNLSRSEVYNILKKVGPSIIKFLKRCTYWDKTNKDPSDPDYKYVKCRADWEILLTSFMTEHPLIEDIYNDIGKPDVSKASPEVQQMINGPIPNTKPRHIPCITFGEAKTSLNPTNNRDKALFLDDLSRMIGNEFVFDTVGNNVYHNTKLDEFITYKQSQKLKDTTSSLNATINKFLRQTMLLPDGTENDLLKDFYLPENKNKSLAVISHINHIPTKDAIFSVFSGNVFSSSNTPSMQDLLLDWICSSHTPTTTSDDTNPIKKEYWEKNHKDQTDDKFLNFTACYNHKEQCRKYFNVMLKHFLPCIKIFELIKFTHFNDIYFAHSQETHPEIAPFIKFMRLIYAPSFKYNLTPKERADLLMGLLMERARNIDMTQLYQDLKNVENNNFPVSEYLKNMSFIRKNGNKGVAAKTYLEQLEFIYNYFSRTMLSATRHNIENTIKTCYYSANVFNNKRNTFTSKDINPYEVITTPNTGIISGHARMAYNIASVFFDNDAIYNINKDIQPTCFNGKKIFFSGNISDQKNFYSFINNIFHMINNKTGSNDDITTLLARPDFSALFSETIIGFLNNPYIKHTCETIIEWICQIEAAGFSNLLSPIANDWTTIEPIFKTYIKDNMAYYTNRNLDDVIKQDIYNTLKITYRNLKVILNPAKDPNWFQNNKDYIKTIFPQYILLSLPEAIMAGTKCFLTTPKKYLNGHNDISLGEHNSKQSKAIFMACKQLTDDIITKLDPKITSEVYKKESYPIKDKPNASTKETIKNRLLQWCNADVSDKYYNDNFLTQVPKLQIPNNHNLKDPDLDNESLQDMNCYPLPESWTYDKNAANTNTPTFVDLQNKPIKLDVHKAQTNINPPLLSK